MPLGPSGSLVGEYTFSLVTRTSLVVPTRTTLAARTSHISSVAEKHMNAILLVTGTSPTKTQEKEEDVSAGELLPLLQPQKDEDDDEPSSTTSCGSESPATSTPTLIRPSNIALPRTSSTC